jgi:hypothetical protein
MKRLRENKRREKADRKRERRLARKQGRSLDDAPGSEEPTGGLFPGPAAPNGSNDEP